MRVAEDVLILGMPCLKLLLSGGFYVCTGYKYKF
jgi:hypothetical protein